MPIPLGHGLADHSGRVSCHIPLTYSNTTTYLHPGTDDSPVDYHFLRRNPVDLPGRPPTIAAAIAVAVGVVPTLNRMHDHSSRQGFACAAALPSTADRPF